jgi:hypothetical protein
MTEAAGTQFAEFRARTRTDSRRGPQHRRQPGRSDVKRVGVAALAALVLLVGCGRTTAGQVAMTTEPLSPDLTCGEFVSLSDSDRVDVVKAILGERAGTAQESQAFVLSALAGVLCRGVPDTPVKKIVLRMKLR